MRAHSDDVLKQVLLEEWIEEMTLCQRCIGNFSVNGTGLAPARREIIAFIERAKTYAESKKPNYNPLKDVNSA